MSIFFIPDSIALTLVTLVILTGLIYSLILLVTYFLDDVTFFNKPIPRKILIFISVIVFAYLLIHYGVSLCNLVTQVFNFFGR